MIARLAFFAACSLPAAGPFDAAGRILAERCAKCHGAGATLSGFDVTSRATVLKGGKLGPAVAPGDPSGSRLYQFAAEGKMPPGAKLPPSEIAALREWIAAGAPWSGPDSLAPAKSKWWAFAPPVKPTGTGSIDAFLTAKLVEKDLAFSPPASPRALIRRLSFNLTGLPPALEDYALGYEAAVEKYLASPRYGERWARHWLDVVRYGETDGGEHNITRTAAWPYRDWVVESFNADKPYTQFIREQIAGDLIAPDDPKTVAATGFLVAGPWDSVSSVLNKDETLKLQSRMDELDDMVTTTAHSFLALTVNCARCHDHKFDPIPTRDYYRMTAFFSAVGFGDREVASAQQRKRREQYLEPLNKRSSDWKRQLAAIEDPVRARLLLAKYQAFDKERENEARRIPLNPIFNRNRFPRVTARHFRFAVAGRGKLENLELRPAGGTSSSGEFHFDAPVSVDEIRFWSDRVRGSRESNIPVYRFEVSDDGQAWREIASSLDHVGLNELALPKVTDAELESALTADARESRRAILEQQRLLQAEIDQAPEVARLYGATPREAAKSYVLERGSVRQRGEEVQPVALSAVGLDTPAGAARLALADWIADARNPLTARVIVNRVWYYHFGNGLVNTPSDFGFNGDRPSHPELLDWLAVSFVENGWSLKWLHRQIVMTRAYRQSSAIDAKAYAADAGNRLVWRMPLRRMDAETMRDSILHSSGNLNLKMGGPSFLLQKKDANDYIYRALDNDGSEVWRRSIYRFVVRGGERIMMDSFDCPDPSVATPQRAASNTPVQALTLMNNAFVLRQAGLLAERLRKEAPGKPVELAYRLLFGREPEPAELERDRTFVEKHSLAALCRVLLNSNEFVYTP